MEYNTQNLQQESINNTNQNISEPVVIKKYKWLRMLPVIQIIIFAMSFLASFTDGPTPNIVRVSLLIIMILPLPFIQLSIKRGYIISVILSTIISLYVFIIFLDLFLNFLN
jgi:hypothetical protein